MLAPIAGWCDLAWRMTCRELGGVGLACTDLLSPQGLLCGSDASLDLARTNEFDQPIGMQLYGSDPGLLADGARWCVDHGATVVDINMGCPVDKVCKKDGGSKLMCIPDTAVEIARAVRSAMPDSVPLTAKMRLGWAEVDAERNAAGDLACRLIDEGVALITVHGRTTEQRFKGQCRARGDSAGRGGGGGQDRAVHRRARRRRAGGRQRGHPLARRCRLHDRGDRVRRRHDRARGVRDAVDLPHGVGGPGRRA
ncbi:MAG: tRNA-dihydrouridine synthase family protein [Planctomycetota bacterium]|nr:MAG: tRNA-dihydrouridine synthase family protein [Planctomycetota bacterium]